MNDDIGAANQVPNVMRSRNDAFRKISSSLSICSNKMDEKILFPEKYSFLIHSNRSSVDAIIAYTLDYYMYI